MKIFKTLIDTLLGRKKVPKVDMPFRVIPKVNAFDNTRKVSRSYSSLRTDDCARADNIVRRAAERDYYASSSDDRCDDRSSCRSDG